MGQAFTDKYSLLHLAVGIVAYYWNISFFAIVVLHIVFEWAENTQTGMNLINRYITMWPGGKPRADSLLNSVGDTVYTVVGWWIADVVERTFPK
jgi:hypothetical protein